MCPLIKGFARWPHHLAHALFISSLLVTEVTPGLLAGAEPDAHQFMSWFVYGRGDRMEVNSDDIVLTPKLGSTCMGR
jgi:hypothetical protein